MIKPKEILKTIIPAIRTPRLTAKKAFFHFISKSQPRIEPVYAPVIGRGIATNIAKPIKPYFST